VLSETKAVHEDERNELHTALSELERLIQLANEDANRFKLEAARRECISEASYAGLQSTGQSQSRLLGVRMIRAQLNMGSKVLMKELVAAWRHSTSLDAEKNTNNATLLQANAEADAAEVAHQQTISAIRDAHKASVDKIKAEHQAAMLVAETAHREGLCKLKEEMHAFEALAMSEKDAIHEAATERRKKEADSDREKWAQIDEERKAHIQALKGANCKALEDAGIESQKALDSLSQHLGLTHAEAEKRIKESHAVVISELRKQGEEALKGEIGRWETVLMEALASHNTTQGSLPTTDQERSALSNVLKVAEEASRAVKLEAEKRHGDLEEKLLQEHTVAIQILEKEHVAAMEAMRAGHESDLEACKLEMETSETMLMIEREAEHATALDQANTALQKLRDELQRQKEEALAALGEGAKESILKLNLSHGEMVLALKEEAEEAVKLEGEKWERIVLELKVSQKEPNAIPNPDSDSEGQQ